MKKTTSVILLGSSNSQGDTYRVSKMVSTLLNNKIIDLKPLNIADFDYEFKNQEDDFFPLMQQLIAQHDIFIFATPVYWYTMSATLKRFLDRFSDLLKIHPETGRKLKGKKMAVISCGSDKVLKEGFHMPFKETANYLHMVYIGDVHTWCCAHNIDDEVKDRLQNFTQIIGGLE